MRNTILRKLNRIVISGKCKNSLVRFQSFLALFSFVFSVCSASLFLIPSSLNAQDPIYPIGLTGGGGASGNPTLQLDNYDAAGMQDFFQDVNAQAGDVDSWVALVVDNIGMVRASWESEADLQIQDYVNNLNVSDNYNGVANYRDALQKELNSQKEAALALWERTANTDIYLQLEKYVTSLTGGIEDEAVVNTESSQSNATEVLSNNRLTPEQIKASFAESKEVWENQFHTSADTGLKQYDDSLDTINANYSRFMRQLDNADGTFQQNLQAIQEYKNNVKSGIRTTVTNLENFLNEPANDSLFGGSNGKSRTQAGLDLNSLIIEFRALLAPNAQDDFSFILTELASKMRDYLGKQAGNAATRQTTIQNQVYTNYVNNDPSGNTNANMNDWNGSTALQERISVSNTGSLLALDSRVSLIQAYINGNLGTDRSVAFAFNERSLWSGLGLSSYNADGTPPLTGRAITSVYGANLFGYSKTAPNLPYWGAWGMNQNLAQNGVDFTWFGAYKPGGADRFNQETFAYKISYQVTDFTAQTNAVTWGNFANQLNTQFSNWQNNLIPTISNWESQAANYNNFYHQWKSNADTLRANAKTEYEASTAKIESDRSKWLLAMENQKKDADKEWDSIESKLTTDEMTGKDLSALLSQTPSADAIAVNSPNAQVNSFNTTLNNLQNTKFNFQSTDYRDEIASYNHTGEKPKDGLSELKKFGIAETIKSALTDPFSNQNSYSIFNPEYNTPSTSVTGINLQTAFTSAFNGVQNLAYVNGTTDAADRYQKEYYDSIVNQYKFNFKEEVMYDLRMKAAIKRWNADAANANNQIALADHYDLKAEQKRIAEFEKNNPGQKVKENAQLAAWNARKNSNGDLDLLSAEDLANYKAGTCYKDLAKCSGFMEVNKDLKSITVENGQIVITREISDGTIHKGGEPAKEGETDYNLVGGYSSGKKTDVIRVNMAKMGVVIQNPKDLFTQWTNEDYNAIADNLGDKADELFASAEKDSKLITNGITESVKRGEQFMQVAMGAAQSAVAKDEMVKSVVQAYLTGGMAGIQSMVKDKIRDAFIDKVAEATGINPDLVRFATGRFEQAKLTKKMNNQASKIGTGVGVMASLALGPVGPLMMAGPMGGALLGAGAGGKLGSSLSGGTLRTTLNNPIVDAGLTMSSGLAGAMMGGPAGLVAGVAAKNKLMQSSSVVSNNNQYNALQQQENALIQDAAGAAVANAIGRPDAAGNFSQILGGLKKRQVAKKNNANLGKVASSGIASALNMANGMVKGIVKNALIAVGGSADTFEHLTANPFTPPATWTGAAKVDMSKEGWKDRIQEYATAEFLEANGMDADLAKTVASTTNAKIKAKKAKKEEKTKAIESTAQTALAVTAMVLTAGAAAPAVAGTATATTAATTTASFTSTIASAISSGISTVGAVLTGTASLGSYVQVASIALQAGIGSRTGGVEGAMAGAANGILQAFAGSLGTKEAGALKDKADEIGQQVNAGLMNMDEGVAALEAAKNAAKLANVGAKTLAATNVSYTKEDGWGIKANVTGLLSAVGVTQGGYGGSLLQRLTNVTIGQSQRGGASLNLGLNTPIGNMGINYTGATGTFGGSYDIMERQVGGLNLSSELSYDGEQGLSVSGNADFGNGLGLGAENGRNGATGSLTLLGSTQGTVNEDGVYEANGNFLGEISGQDIIDLHNTRAQQEGNSILEDAARNAPAKSAKDAANSDNSVDDRDNDAQEETGGQGSEGLVDLVFAGTAVLFSAGAAFIAGGGSSAASPSVPTSGQGAAGNGGNATVARKPEDDEPPKKQPTKEELDNFKDNVFLNTTRAVTDDYLNKLDAQGVDTKEMRAHAEAQRAAGVRDLTPAEIQAKRLNKELNDLKSELDKASTIAHDNGTLSDATNSPMSEILKYRDEVNKKIAEKEKEIKQAIDANNKQQAANLNQSFQTGIGNIAKSHEAMNEATNIARKDTSQAGNLNQSFQTNSSNIELGRNALNEGTKTSEADKIKQAKDLDQAWKTKKESMDSTINVRGVREAYSAANLTERSYIGEKWDSVFNNNGIKDTGTGIYTGRVLREGGYLGGLFGATVYHERLDNFVAVDHGQPSLVHIDEVKGDNNLPFNHERILRNTPQGPIKEDLIWSGSTRSNNGQGSYNQNDANQPNVAYHRVVRGTGENQTQSIVGENGLFTSGFISPTNDNINFYNQSSTTLLGNKYQVTNIRQDNGLMREGWDMGGYEASRRPDKQNVRENYFALTDGPDFPDLPPRNSNGVFSPTAADNGVFISQGDPSHGPLKSADFPNNPFHTIPDPNGEFNDAQKAHRDNGHYATDLTPRNGENGPIIPDLYASKDGKVVGINPSSDNTLIIRYDDGTEVAYKHESGIARNIFPGQRVVAGQYVGRIGNIGNSKGAHLHLEVTNPRLSTSEMKNQYYGGSY